MRKRNRSNSKFGYGNLEPRVMLTGDLDVARNLVMDGDFEDAASTAFVSFIDGDDTNTQNVSVRELSTSFSRVAQVDSVAGQVDSLTQNIATETGNEYIVSFDLRGRNLRAGDAADTNDVEVFFGGQSLGTFRAVGQWQTITLSTTADSDMTLLEFRESSADSDGRGIFVDHVAIAGVGGIEIINNSFEEVDADNSTGVVAASAVPGFSAIDASGDPEIGILTTDAADGNNVLNLNTSDSHLDRVFHNVDTEAGGLYYVTFEIRNGDAADTDPANVRLRWNGDFAGSFLGTAEWQRVGLILEGVSETSTLTFRERGTDLGSGLDVQIDNLQYFKIDSIESDFTLDLNGTNVGEDVFLSYVENSEAVLSPSRLEVGFTNGDVLNSGTARILDFTGSESLSAVTDGTNIEVSFNNSNGILRLVGRDTPGNYQRVLRSLSFTDSSDDPVEGIREVLVSVTDGTASSARRSAVLDVMAVNDAPVITDIEDIVLAQNSPLTVNIGATDADDSNTDLIYDLSLSGDTFIFGDTLPTISDSGQIMLEAQTHGDVEFTVTVEDPNGAVSELTFNVNIDFVAPTGQIPDDFVPFSGQRQLSDALPLARNDIYDSAPPLTIDTSLDYRAIFETENGDIIVDLFASESPITVNNFVNLAEDGFYDGVTFHRVIDGFVAQGGDPSGTGAGGPGYTFVDEIDNGLQFSGIGQLAMANAGPNTNGSQFFFTLNENPQFAGEHTIFGEISIGENVLFDISQTDVIERVRIEIV